MAKNAAYTGESGRDRAVNIMDKFISKGLKQESNKPFKTSIRKDPSIPVDQWPLRDQIEYWENRPKEDWFKEDFPVYSYWITEVRKHTNVHPTFFADSTAKMKPELQEMYDTCVSPKEAARELRKRGVY